jgi:hypothetical protein
LVEKEVEAYPNSPRRVVEVDYLAKVVVADSLTKAVVVNSLKMEVVADFPKVGVEVVTSHCFLVQHSKVVVEVANSNYYNFDPTPN